MRKLTRQPKPNHMLYLAGPLFNPRERAFNAHIADLLEPFGAVYLPQRDGSLLAEMVQAGVPVTAAERRVYLQDCEALRRSSLLVAVLDGAHVDEGVAFEIGFAQALGCTCYGLQTDVRRALPTGNNPMLLGALGQIFNSVEDLVAHIAALPLLADADARVAG